MAALTRFSRYSVSLYKIEDGVTIVDKNGRHMTGSFSSVMKHATAGMLHQKKPIKVNSIRTFKKSNLIGIKRGLYFMF